MPYKIPKNQNLLKERLGVLERRKLKDTGLKVWWNQSADINEIAQISLVITKGFSPNYLSVSVIPPINFSLKIIQIAVASERHSCRIHPDGHGRIPVLFELSNYVKDLFDHSDAIRRMGRFPVVIVFTRGNEHNYA